jgi:hypothetical protein
VSRAKPRRNKTATSETAEDSMTTGKRGARALGLLICLSAGAAQAAPFGFFDPRSAAMGGAGVSAATSGNASYLNPALLALPRPKDRWAVEIPIVGVRAVDSQKLIDDIDRLEPVGDDLSNAVDAFNASQSQTNSGALANALGNFRRELGTMSSKSLDASVFAAPLTVGVPGKTLGVGVHAAARADLGVQFLYAGSDDALLLSFQNAAQAYATSGSAADLNAMLTAFGTGPGGTLNDPNLQSRVNLRGLVQAEAGVSLAHQYDSLDGLAIGITPKVTRVRTLDYSVTAQDTEIDLNRGKTEHSGGNIDLGVAKEMGSFRAGLVGKNLVKRSYETALGNKIDLKPQFRAGVSHHTDWTTVAFDLDLTKNDPAGLDQATRYAGLGLEFDIGLLKFRAGYRKDLAGNYPAIPSVGLGISLFGLHLDVAAAKKGDEEAMVVAQFGFRY